MVKKAIHIDFNEIQIRNYVEKMRPPQDIRDQLDIGFKFENNILELIEIRPQFQNRAHIVNFSFAKAKYIKSKNIWKIYWMRASGKWEFYEPNPEVTHIRSFFDIVEKDEYGCFKG